LFGYVLKKKVEIGDVLDEMYSYWAEQYEEDHLT